MFELLLLLTAQRAARVTRLVLPDQHCLGYVKLAPVCKSFSHRKSICVSVTLGYGVAIQRQEYSWILTGLDRQ